MTKQTANALTNSKKVERDAMVLEYLPLVKSIAVRVREGLPTHVELDDLHHAGVLGLIDAATKFDTKRDVAFAAYAKFRIRGAILDSLRDMDWASREARRRYKQIEAATRQLSAELQREPSEDEVADRVGIKVDQLRQLRTDMHDATMISSDARPKGDSDLPALEFPAPVESQPDSISAREQMRHSINKALHVLAPRHRQVVTMYYMDGRTMKQIGDTMGVNESRVSQIHKAALSKMHGVLAESGIQGSAAF